MSEQDVVELLTLISDLGSSEDKSRQSLACEIKRLTSGIRAENTRLQKAVEWAEKAMIFVLSGLGSGRIELWLKEYGKEEK